MADEWYYTEQGQQRGPVTSSELKRLASAKQLQPSDLVWKDGLPQWVAASTVKGLFPNHSRQSQGSGRSNAATSTEDDVETFDYVEQGDDDIRPAGRRPRRRSRLEDVDEYDDDEDYEERPRRRRRKRVKKGMPAGLKAVLIVGGILLLLAVLSCTGFLIISFSSLSSSASGTNPYTVSLSADPNHNFMGDPRNARAWSRHEQRVEFKAGQNVEVRVSNSSPNADVDLYIFDPAGREIMRDDAADSNCFVRFRCPQTGTYSIIVQNLGPARANCTVHYVVRGAIPIK